MNIASVLSIAAKESPDTLVKVEDVLHQAVVADKTLLPDLITAAGTNSWSAFAVKHVGTVVQVAEVVAGDPAIVSALQKSFA